MDATDRQLMIERLQAANVESTVEIERRQAERERDPFAFDDHLRDERGAEPEPSPPVSENDEPLVLYRRYDGNALYDGPDDGDGGDELMQALDRFADATTKALADDARRIAELRAENVEVKGLLRDALEKFSKLEGKLDDALKRLEQTDAKLRNMAADVDAERKDHIGRMTAFQVEVAELRGRVSAVLRDWTT
jgi:hypothetical protein